MFKLYQKLLTLALGACLGLLFAGNASAMLTPQCPPISYAQGCNVVITIGSDGSVTLTFPNATSYDNSDDQLVGVQNNTGGILNSISLSSSRTVFGFDRDGAASAFPSETGIPGSYGTAHGGPFGPTGYEGPDTSFSLVSSNKHSGNVNFLQGISNGGSAWFSLETMQSVNGFIVTSFNITSNNGSVPEPGTMLLIGSGLSMLLFSVRKKCSS